MSQTRITCIKKCLQNYSSKTIEKHILKDIINNIIFDTKTTIKSIAENLSNRRIKDLKEEI